MDIIGGLYRDYKYSLLTTSKKHWQESVGPNGSEGSEQRACELPLHTPELLTKVSICGDRGFFCVSGGLVKNLLQL